VDQLSVISLFCEDIREDKNNTDMVIGIMPDGVIIESLGGRFPRLAIYTRLHAPRSIEVTQFAISLYMPDGHVISIGEMPPEEIKKSYDVGSEKGSLYQGLILKAIIGSLPVVSEGWIKAVVTVNGKQYMGGALNVVVQPPRRASPDERRGP
jgi:hypothetical protein